MRDPFPPSGLLITGSALLGEVDGRIEGDSPPNGAHQKRRCCRVLEAERLAAEARAVLSSLEGAAHAVARRLRLLDRARERRGRHAPLSSP